VALDLTEMNELLDDLKRARASGVLVVKHGDTTTTYRSVDEITKAISELEGDIAKAAGRRRRRVRYVSQRSKGYGC
jgi:biopolymer transport protein ExbD